MSNFLKRLSRGKKAKTKMEHEEEEDDEDEDYSMYPPEIQEALRKKDEKLKKEKRGREEAEARAANAEAILDENDGRPQWLWKERLARSGPSAEFVRPKTMKTSATLSSTVDYAQPDIVKKWVDFKVPDEPLLFKDLKTIYPLDLFGEAPLSLYSPEAHVSANFLIPFIRNIITKVINPHVWKDLRYTAELLATQALIPDLTCYTGTIGDAKSVKRHFVTEFKLPYKYPRKPFGTVPQSAGNIDLVKFYEQIEKPEYSPVRQIYTYSCVENTKYCVLTTGCYTWFMRRSISDDGKKGILEMSETFAVDAKGPSLAQAWVHFISLVYEDRDIIVPPPEQDSVNLVVANNKKEVARLRKAQEDLNKETAGSSTTNKNTSKKSTSSSTQVVEPLLNNQELCFRFEPVQSFDVEHGVVHRMNVHGNDAIVKMVDCVKDYESKERLDHEIDMYKRARNLWGDVLPTVLFEGDVNLGRKSLILTYEGQSMEEHELRDLEEAKKALEKLHMEGILHGDIAFRNIVRDEEGKVKLIDLGSARVLDDPNDPRFEKELQQLNFLFQQK